MKKLALIFGLLMVVSMVQADQYWDGGGGADTSWTTAANWNDDTLPDSGERVFLDIAGDVLIEAGDSVQPRKIIGPGEGITGIGTLIVEGTLTNTSYWYLGRTTSGTGVLNVNGGSVFTRDLILGAGTDYAGIVNVNSGLLEINGGISGTGAYFGNDPVNGLTTGSATINVYGGILDITLLNTLGENALINIAGGQMILEGDQTSVISGYGSQIVAYGGTSDLSITTFDDEGVTYTSVIAVPEPATLCLLGFGALALIRRKQVS